MNSSEWVVVTNWEEISPHLSSEDPIQLLIPKAVSTLLGAPVLKAYQDQLLSYPHISLTIECATSGQTLSCLHHGILRIIYENRQSLKALQSIAKQKKAFLSSKTSSFER